MKQKLSVNLKTSEDPTALKINQNRCNHASAIPRAERNAGEYPHCLSTALFHLPRLRLCVSVVIHPLKHALLLLRQMGHNCEQDEILLMKKEKDSLGQPGFTAPEVAEKE